MKTIELTQESPNLEGILDLAGQDNLILKTSDGREFVLAEVDQFDREIELTRKNEELIKFLDQRSEEEGLFSIQEARERLNLT